MWQVNLFWLLPHSRKIKAKMLIPRKQINDLGEEIDPREELVQKLFGV